MKTALVTGSCGFLGRRLVPKLHSMGYDVCEVDAELGLSLHTWLSMRESASGGWNTILHLAANIVNVNQRMKNKLGAYRDIELDMAMMRYVSEHPPKECFIYPSSCAVDYPDDPYGFVKIMGEKMCGVLAKEGVPVVVLRPFSGYSGSQSLEYPFPAILKRVIDGENPVTVWGSGDQIRDWIHIDDLTDAFTHAIDHFPRDATPVEVGTGVGTSIYRLTEMMIAEVYNRTEDSEHTWPDIKPLTEFEESSPKRVANTGLARACEWEAGISLKEGIKKEVDKWK